MTIRIVGPETLIDPVSMGGEPLLQDLIESTNRRGHDFIPDGNGNVVCEDTPQVPFDLEKLDIDMSLPFLVSKGCEVTGIAADIVLTPTAMLSQVPEAVPDSKINDGTDEAPVWRQMIWSEWPRTITDEGDGGDPSTATGNKIIECSDGRNYWAGSVLVAVHQEPGVTVHYRETNPVVRHQTGAAE